MRSLDEQMREIQKREAGLRERRHGRRTALLSGLSCAVCICLIAVVAIQLPAMTQAAGNEPPIYYGSALFGSPAAGLSLIILLSFALGVSVTLLCRALPKTGKKRKNR